MTTSIATNPEFDRYVTETGETDNIDAKGPLLWDNGEASARLAKDFAAFANSKDGGVIVIGKSELADGRFALDGVSQEQARSFETTKVSRWVNNHFAPPISLACHVHNYDDKLFVVITIQEFSDIPHICTKSFIEPGSKNNHLLRERLIYVRNSGSESTVLGSVDELRMLVGLATSKRGHELIASFNAMLRGNPLLPERSSQEQFEAELSQAELDLGKRYTDGLESGAWKLVIRPSEFRVHWWGEDADLEAIVRRRIVRLRSEFPPSTRGTHRRDWGIANEAYRETWGLTNAGQFFLVRPFYENRSEYECRWRDISGELSEPRLPPGKWIDFKPSIFTLAEMFTFAERFVQEYGTGQRLSFEITATALAGRHLVTTDSNINRDMTPACRTSRFRYERQATVEEFQSQWEDACAIAMKRFTDLFPDTETSLETMRYWVEKFKNRDF